MDGLGLYATGIQGLLFGLALIAVLGGLDDLVIDIAYLIYRFQGRRAAVDWPLREEHLKALTEQPLAVMVPAWQEAGVIAGMLDNLLRSVDYRDYAVFVGVYPNDPETAREVEHIRRRDRRIHIVA
ncbi:MAG TPA: glycosyltransferase, partial [Alphaproteobacteria bacterium]|nr:glycosyltransferase [Alphaproteobacteria bacterium]